MVTIRTTEDFIKAMDENPEWLEAVRSRLLTRELLNLPRRFEELSVFVRQLAAAQVELKEATAKLAAAQVELKKEMANLAAAQAELKKEMANLAAAQVELKKEMANLAAAQVKLKEAMANLTAVQAEMMTTQKKHGDDIGFLNGIDVERLLGKQVYGLLGGYPLRMRRVRILRAYFWTGETDKFNDAVNDANDAGEISDEQYDRLMRTDLIVAARRRGSARDVYLALEASGKISRDDVDRANRSKEALRMMFAESEVLAAVYGREMSEADRRYADSNDVTAFLTVPSSIPR